MVEQARTEPLYLLMPYHKVKNQHGKCGGKKKNMQTQKLSFLEEMFLCDNCKNKALAWGTLNIDKFGKDCYYYQNCVNAKLEKLNSGEK